MLKTNNSHLLSTYIRSVITEELVPLKKGKKQASKSSFSLEVLSSLPSYDEQLTYCQDSGLVLLGKGTARIVFQLTKKSVIKLAISDAGKDQNQVEAQAKSCSKVHHLFAEVLQADKNFTWIVMEKVKPLTSDPEFKEHSGLEIATLRGVITYWYAENMQKARHKQFEPSDYKALLTNPLVATITQIVKDCDMLPGDFARASSWGLTQEGTLVLIDYGLSKSIYMKYYYQ